MKIDVIPNRLQMAEEDSRLDPEQKAKLRQVAQQFEAVFLNQMVGAMRKTVTPGGIVPQGQGEKIYQSMLDSEHASAMAQSGQFGLTDMIYEHLLRSSGGR